MSRPKPKVLLSKTDRVTYKTEEVLESTAIWAVFFDGKPINLKTSTNPPDVEVRETLGFPKISEPSGETRQDVKTTKMVENNNVFSVCAKQKFA